eukprot:jgi/Tetstr1/430448/TSEL_020258.t1
MCVELAWYDLMKEKEVAAEGNTSRQSASAPSGAGHPEDLMDLDWDQPQDDAELDGVDSEEETAKKLFSERVINEVRSELTAFRNERVADRKTRPNKWWKKCFRAIRFDPLSGRVRIPSRVEADDFHEFRYMRYVELFETKFNETPKMHAKAATSSTMADLKAISSRILEKSQAAHDATGAMRLAAEVPDPFLDCVDTGNHGTLLHGASCVELPVRELREPGRL